MSVDSFVYQGRGVIPVRGRSASRASPSSDSLRDHRDRAERIPRTHSDAPLVRRKKMTASTPPLPSQHHSSNSSGIGRTVSGMMKKRKHVVLLGLDGSGKTTILLRLKYGCKIKTAPTIGFNHEKVWGSGLRWSAWDVGGGEKFRPLWVMYARATDGLVFVIDAASSSDLIEEARVELSRVVKALKASVHTMNTHLPPVLVLANFQDRPYARNSEELSQCLGLSETWASGMLWAVAPVCGLTGEGVDNALFTLRTLIDGNLKERKKTEKGWPW